MKFDKSSEENFCMNVKQIVHWEFRTVDPSLASIPLSLLNKMKRILRFVAAGTRTESTVS